MQIGPTPLDGVFVIEPKEIADGRGFFARIYARELFESEGLNTDWPQVNNSLSRKASTLRGLHFQRQPMGECKLVRCVAGSVWDVVVDVREGSPTFGKWFGIELSASDRRMIYVGQGLAHGYLSLTDNAEVIYASSASYSPQHECTLNALDPALGIDWPVRPTVLSEKDRSALLLEGTTPW